MDGYELTMEGWRVIQLIRAVFSREYVLEISKQNIYGSTIFNNCFQILEFREINLSKCCLALIFSIT